MQAGRQVGRHEDRQSGRHTRRNCGHACFICQTLCFSLFGCSTGTPRCPTTPSTSSWGSTFPSSSWAPSSTCYFWDKFYRTFGQSVIQSFLRVQLYYYIQTSYQHLQIFCIHRSLICRHHIDRHHIYTFLVCWQIVYRYLVYRHLAYRHLSYKFLAYVHQYHS